MLLCFLYKGFPLAASTHKNKLTMTIPNIQFDSFAKCVQIQLGSWKLAKFVRSTFFIQQR